MDTLNLYLLAGAGVLLAAVIAVRVASRVGMPGLLAFLLVGIALGESGVGIRFDDEELTQLVGFAALAVILAEGGLTTRWSDIRPVIGLSVVLSTLGVLTSVAAVAVCAHVALGFDWRL